jgi:hypothetical protein
MIDNFEFSDTKQIRKTILITAFAGICFKILVKNATGNIEFLGFKIPIEDAHVIPQLIGCVIIFEIIALIIRYSDEGAREKYKKYLKFIEERNMSEILLKRNDEYVPLSLKPNYMKVKVIEKSVLFLDIIFPIILGIGALIKIFFF